jgi:hypothetical protein
MKHLNLMTLATSLLLFSCAPTPEGTSFKNILSELKYDLLNPESIEVREAEWVKFISVSDEPSYAFRFYVNGDNMFGGKTGYQLYFAINYVESNYIAYEPDTLDTYLESTVNAIFATNGLKGTLGQQQIDAILRQI